jgi:molybdopterin synthase catalytic subunit
MKSKDISMNSRLKINQSKMNQTVASNNTNVVVAHNDDNDERINSNSIKRITTEEIDTCELFNSLKDKKGKSGATVVFVGTVRNYGKNGPVKEMFYESYVKMADNKIKNIEKIAVKRWNIKKIRIIHRIGSIKLGNSSIVIALSTPHSKDAFEACEFILAAIKKEVPIWKKEILSNSKEKWVIGNSIISGE